MEVTGAPNESAIAYGAPEVPLMLVFDAPLEVQDGGMVPLGPGIDARPHPFNASALVVILSPSLAGHGPIPLKVPLKGRVASVTVELEKDQLDHVLRILKRDKAHLGTNEAQQSFRVVSDLVVGQAESKCGVLPPSLPQPEKIPQDLKNKVNVLVCALDSISYLRVARTRPQCRVAQVRLVRTGNAAEVLFLAGTRPCKRGTCQLMAVATPLDGADDYELDLLAADGTLCERHVRVSLRPGGEP